MSEKVAVAVIWHGPDLVMEERWVDKEDGGQETRYAFPGGKVEAKDDDEAHAASREVFEEVGVMIEPEHFGEPEQITVGDDEGYFFEVRLPYGTKLGDGSIVVWTRDDLMTSQTKGTLMPLTNEYVKRYF